MARRCTSRIPFASNNIFPVYDKIALVRDKCLVSDMLHTSILDCDQLFIPEFLEVKKYCVEKFDQLYGTDNEDTGQELSQAFVPGQFG